MMNALKPEPLMLEPANENENPKQFFGSSKGIQKIKKNIDRLKGLTLPVFIYGEMGTGKSFLGKYIHKQSKLSHLPFHHLYAESLTKRNLFSIHSGTVLIEEVANLTPVKEKFLASYLQSLKNDAQLRVITTSGYTESEFTDGQFIDKELFELLSVCKINIPPLRERVDDLEQIFSYYYKLHFGHPIQDKKHMENLLRYDWPGNIREVKNFFSNLKKKVAVQDNFDMEMVKDYIQNSSRCDEDVNCLRDVIFSVLDQYFKTLNGSQPASGLYAKVLEELERPLFELTLKNTKGNQIKAADILGLNRNTLRKKLTAYDIKVSKS